LDVAAACGGGGAKQSSSGVSDSTCAYSIADEIYCGTKLQELCTMFLLGFDGVVCCLGSMLIILVCTVRSYPPTHVSCAMHFAGRAPASLF
jgi:hypothetical protein